MKISEVSERAGVTASTLKYYIRDGLVPEGQRVGSNRTDYTESHVQRVKLARALIETGGLSVAAARHVLGVLDTHTESLPHVFEAAQNALASGSTLVVGSSTEASRQRVTALMAARSWQATSDNPGFELAARALDGLATIGYVPSVHFLEAYADAADTVARADLAALSSRSDPALIAELMVVGTVMGDALQAGLRRLAQQHETTALFPDGATQEENTRP